MFEMKFNQEFKFIGETGIWQHLGFMATPDSGITGDISSNGGGKI